MANTKLTPAQKADRKCMISEAKALGINVVNLDNKTVMAYKERVNTVEFALSVMSPDEQKFRAKVGEFLALNKFFAGETVKMDKFDFQTMTEYVWDAYLIDQ